MRTLLVKAVIIVDADGEHIVHGNSQQTPAEMFKTMTPLWSFDPSKEQIHYVEVEVGLPEYERIEHAPTTDTE